MTRLLFKDETRLPIVADAISPDRLDGLSAAEVAALPALKGRRAVTIGDLFEVSGDGSDEIELEGNLAHCKHIGAGMTRGRIEIWGDVGMHLGAGMRGGEIVVHGDAAAWAGARMASGRLHVRGSAGPMLGAAYTGERLGMRGGEIRVDGPAGIRAGERMRRGLIVIGGDAGEFTGTRMVAGTIIVLGRLGSRAGAGMKRGTLVGLGGTDGALLPTFQYACHYRPVYLRVIWQHLRAWGIEIRDEWTNGSFVRYTGDVNTIGKGEILIYGQNE